ncbi:MAG: phosphoglucomutase [Bacteroidetes bacterium]|nr:phosphoglucomutase [Bacteroidota bacterium]
MTAQTLKFGNDGWRALTGMVFTEENLLRVADAFVRYLRATSLEGRPIAVGFDGRYRSDAYAALFAEVLSGCGFPVLLSDRIIPTPVLSYTVFRNGCGAGIMITASHNPASYNGVKFKASYGGPFVSEETRRVASFVQDRSEFPRSAALVRTTDMLTPYTEHLRTVIDFDTLRTYAADPANDPSVMIDSMGGAGQTILEDILTGLGWRAQTIFGSAEPGFYGRQPEPIEKNLEPLFYNVSVTDAILGIATDGDADRCAVCTGDGTWVSVQQTILLLLWHLHKNKKMSGAVIKSVPVTDKVRVLAERWHLPFYDVNVSFQNITDIMLKTDYLIGVEESAGFGVKGHLPERDGILSGLLFCEMLAMSRKNIPELWQEIRAVVGELHYRRLDIPAEELDRTAIMQRCEHFHPSRNLEEFFIEKVRKLYDKETLNGIKFLFGDSRWLLIRASMTEPKVRIYAEGRTEDELERLLAEGRMLVGIP